MSMMIILTAEEAMQVVGLSPSPHEWAALEPVPIKGGEYVLPPEVMADPCHADVEPFLATLPTRDVADDEFFLDTPEAPISDIEAQMYADAKLSYREQETMRGTSEREAEVAIKVAEKQALKAGPNAVQKSRRK